MTHDDPPPPALHADPERHNPEVADGEPAGEGDGAAETELPSQDSVPTAKPGELAHGPRDAAPAGIRPARPRVGASTEAETETGTEILPDGEVLQGSQDDAMPRSAASLVPDLSEVTLAEWQVAACDAWERGDNGGTHRGTLEIFTGGGKSLIALECLSRARTRAPDLRTVIVVPTLALARQWSRVVIDRLRLPHTDVGRLDGEHDDRLVDKAVLIAVLNSAADKLPAMAAAVDEPVMLIVDECHRAGAPSFSRVLDTRAEYRLGLSATAQREDVDEDGVPIDYDEHLLGRQLGRIVYTFDLRQARAIGWLPEFSVHHHGIALRREERDAYDELTRRVDDLADRLRDVGVDAGSARAASARPGDVGSIAKAYVGAVSLRKDLLYRAAERPRVVALLVERIMGLEPGSRILLFHERVAEATSLHARLSDGLVSTAVGLEHSRMRPANRIEALNGFATGTTPVLVSVKALVEGIDVPDADVGISVASSSSVRQRVQALGRVLRRRFDGTTKVAQMHVLYAADTADEAIYGREDWSDLTGDASNHYWLWPLAADEPDMADGPPRTPRPTEEQFWTAVGDGPIDEPVEWTPEWPAYEWRLDTRGTVTDLSGRPVSNSQHVADLVRRIRPRGGRFRVSPRTGAVVVPDVDGERRRAWLVGRLDEPLRTSDPTPADASSASAEKRSAAPATSGREPPHSPPAVSADAPPNPGAQMPMTRDTTNGTFKLRQKGGGIIERRTSRGSEFAGSSPGEGNAQLVANAARVLSAWKQTGETGLSFHVDAEDTAYYLRDGAPRFLAHVPGGFAWPSDEEELGPETPTKGENS